MRQVLGLVVVVAALASPVRAQSASALADQLFKEARELAKKNRWAEACPKFEASFHAEPLLGARLNLATCYEHIGRLASAWNLYQEAAELARTAGDGKRAGYAQRQAAALEPRLPRLSISAAPHAPPGLVITRDERVIDAGELGVARYLDPGPHAVTISAPGFEPRTFDVVLVESQAVTLELPELTPTPAPPRAPIEPIASRETPPPTRTYAALGLGGAGVVAVAVGLVFGAKASSALKDARSLCGPSLVCSTSTELARDTQLIHDSRTSGTTSTLLVTAGAAALVAGAIVLLTAPHARERSAIIPVPQANGGLLVLAREL